MQNIWALNPVEKISSSDVLKEGITSLRRCNAIRLSQVP